MNNNVQQLVREFKQNIDETLPKQSELLHFSLKNSACNSSKSMEWDTAAREPRFETLDEYFEMVD